MTSSSKRAQHFLARVGEKEEFNQYWYSPSTIDALVGEIEAHTRPSTTDNATHPPHDHRVAFLSTPSLFFAFDHAEQITKATLFDLDDSLMKRCSSPDQFVKFDFNYIETIDARFHHKFTFVVADPPFITEDVWRKYARAIKLLLVDEASQSAAASPVIDTDKHWTQPEGVSSVFVDLGQIPQRNDQPNNRKVLVTSIYENADRLEKLLGVKICRWRPKIPNLVYQYSLFVDYDSKLISDVNPEVD